MKTHAKLLLLLLASVTIGPAAAQDMEQSDFPNAAVWRDGQWEALSPADVMADTLISLRVTTGNNLGLTVYNNGFLGTNLVNRSPSMEYPLRSGQEHLIRAGIWVAGLPAGGGDTLTTTATIDGRVGSFDPKQISEFFPAESGIRERSILLNSCCYDVDAKSEQDFLASYFDSYSGLNPDHHPLGIRVELETLLFSFEPFDAIVIANYKIINTNLEDPIYNVYVGMYSELASGWKDGHTEWPPTGWFSRKDIGYVDSLRIMTEHHYLYDGGNCPSWDGISLLGTRPRSVHDMHVSFNWWNWDPNLTQPGTPRNDKERFETLSNRSIDGTAGVEAPNNDPVELLSVGPLGDVVIPDSIYVLEPGDTVTVAFAFVGGQPSPRDGRNAEEDLLFNARWAQTAFDLNFNIPVPPPSPTLLVTPTLGKLTLRWKRDPEEFMDPKSHKKDFEGYRIYISESKEEEGFRMIRQADIVDSLLENTGLEALRDPVTIDGVQYEYRYDITGLRDGFKYWVSVTAFDTGAPDIGPLESGRSQNRTFAIPGGPAADVGKVKVFPNPYRGDAAWDGTLPRDRYLWFVNLPHRCTIKIYTLAGDLVDTIEFDGSTYDATEIRGIFDPTDTHNPESDIPVLSGGMAAWDLVSRADQGIATGLYIFSVKDLESGDTQLGKFLVLR
jgi:hypothetical protein